MVIHFPFSFRPLAWVALVAVLFIHAGAQIPQALPDTKPGPAPARAAVKETQKTIKILGVEISESELASDYKSVREEVAYREGMAKPLTRRDYEGSYSHYRSRPSRAAQEKEIAKGIGVKGLPKGVDSRVTARIIDRPPGEHHSGVVIREKNLPIFKFTRGAKVVDVSPKGIIVLDIPRYKKVFVQPRRNYGVKAGDVLEVLLKQDEHRRRGPYKETVEDEVVHLELWQDYTLSRQEHLVGLRKNFFNARYSKVREKQLEILRRQAKLDEARKPSSR